MTEPADLRRHRYTAALAGRIETAWQDRWEREGTFHAAEPDRSAVRRASTRSPAARAATCWTCSRTRAALGCTSATRWATSAPTCTRATCGCPGPTCCTRWASTRSGCRPSSTRWRPGSTRGRPPRPTSGPTGGSCAGSAWATTSAAASPPPTSTSTAGPSGSSCRSSTPGTTRPRAGPGPIAELVAELDAGSGEPAEGTNPSGRPWAELSAVERRQVVDAHRLAYRSDAVVNWCPGLGTVLANEEVTPDGRSERGNFPVYRRPLTQWMMRITAYADRLIDDLDTVDWPESVAQMQRNWIGRSSRRAGPLRLARRRHRGLHHPAGHAVRRHVLGAGPGAPAGGRRSRPTVAGRRRRRSGPAAPRTPARGRRRLPRGSGRGGRSWSGRPRAGTRPACSPGRTRSTRSTASRCRSSSPTTC